MSNQWFTRHTFLRIISNTAEAICPLNKMAKTTQTINPTRKQLHLTQQRSQGRIKKRQGLSPLSSNQIPIKLIILSLLKRGLSRAGTKYQQFNKIRHPNKWLSSKNEWMRDYKSTSPECNWNLITKILARCQWLKLMIKYLEPQIKCVAQRIRAFPNLQLRRLPRAQPARVRKSGRDLTTRLPTSK